MSKSNAYANRFSKALGLENNAPPADAEKTVAKTNVYSFPERKIGGAENGDKPSETASNDGLQKSEPVAAPLETAIIGKPAVPVNGADFFTVAEPQTKIEIQTETSRAARRMPVFKTVEINAEKVEPHLVAITHPQSPHSEEYRNLRTQLLLGAERRRFQGKQLQAVVVASARPGEGKTTTAINLAWLMAQTDGVNCLLIDSDLRMPSVADYLGIEEQPGLSDVFEGTVELEQAIVKANPAGLHILPGGNPRGDVAELLSGNAFRRILDQARGMFDYIFIDAPPLAIFTDAAALINLSDGAMLVVKAGQTGYARINRLL